MNRISIQLGRFKLDQRRIVPNNRQLLCQTVHVVLSLLLFSLDADAVGAQNERCDPAKVIGSETCAKCHVNEVSSWKQTPHFRTFDELGRRPEAKAICDKLGLRSVKRSDVCIDCHFTMQNVESQVRPISGISCESCHGAAAPWIELHNNFGGPTATRESETSAHAAQRFAASLAGGMHNTRNLYQIASSCFHCHTVPNESLVNIGGHKAGSEDFELVRWSQGRVRHNFLRTAGQTNANSSPERLRVMFVIGLMADLEFSTRATAMATKNSTYGTTVANRAARVALRLYEVQQKIQDPHVQRALQAFAGAELRLNNALKLLAIADEIKQAGEMFALENDGTQLAILDPWLPNPSEYR